jgi:alpha-beta hydrolase superfamily lysophospholipase
MSSRVPFALLLLTCDKEEKRRPLFFLGHSTGGLVIKAALIKALGSDLYHVVGDNCYGVAFFGIV